MLKKIRLCLRTFAGFQIMSFLSLFSSKWAGIGSALMIRGAEELEKDDETRV